MQKLIEENKLITISSDYTYDEEKKVGNVTYTIENNGLSNKEFDTMLEKTIGVPNLFTEHSIFLETNYKEPVTVEVQIAARNEEALQSKIGNNVHFDGARQRLDFGAKDKITINSDLGEKVVEYENNTVECEHKNMNGFDCNRVAFVQVVKLNDQVVQRTSRTEDIEIKNPDNHICEKVKESYKDNRMVERFITVEEHNKYKDKDMVCAKEQIKEYFNEFGASIFCCDVRDFGDKAEKDITTPDGRISLLETTRTMGGNSFKDVTCTVFNSRTNEEVSQQIVNFGAEQIEAMSKVREAMNRAGFDMAVPYEVEHIRDVHADNPVIKSFNLNHEFKDVKDISKDLA